jgi:hypothetical protein
MISVKNLLGKSATLEIDASLDGLAQRVVEDRERDEMAQASGSSTTVVTAAVPQQARKKQKVAPKNSTWDTVVAPEIALPNARLPGNQLKSSNAANPALVMRALYDDAQALAKTLCEFEKFTPYMHLVFNEDGLSMQVLHSTRTVSVELTVPEASFFRYENLCKGTAVCVAVSSAAVKTFGSNGAESTQTLSFLYHQCGRDDEPLHVQLNPRDNDPATAIKVFYHLPNCEDEDTVQVVPERQLQYEVRLDARQFLAAVRRLAKTTSSIVLQLRQAADGTLTFEMGGVTDQFAVTSLAFGHAAAADRTSAQCTIVCREPRSPASRLEHFLNHRLLAALIESVATFGSLSCASEVVIGLGVKADKKGGYAEEPVRLTFPMRTDTRAPFTVDAWVCPETEKT